ncbi:MAG: YceI family protein [Melioribacteraceae bacterium]|nr:YceI family protein [Melioribacteraceae bacterium]MCF8353003.1 YceI family protein [Melioribacteraceae bacterium]MCF8392894.1 YceI family protein [Melioribacteraceae bacterium]MCF8417812.1 YceI family protein [Melioribacteraceae bacterium]
MKKILTIFLLFSITLLATEYQVDKSKKNTVKFISDAPVENFEGVTDNIDGYMLLNSVDDLSETQLYFEVDLNTIDTGIGLRNRHMRDNYLETDKYRFTFFEGKFTKITKLSEDELDVEVKGKIFIHGITKEISVTGKMIKDGEGYRIKSKFEVELSDYKIDIPQVMFLKIDETMKLELDFFVEVIS